MDDTQLTSLRDTPTPAFAERLRSTLARQDEQPALSSRRWMKPVLAPVVAVVVLSALLSVPAVRASAESFLALFRVVNFVAVPVDEERLAVLESTQFDPQHLIGNQLQVLEQSSPMAVLSVEQASEAAGFAVRVPSYMPTSALLAGIEVVGTQRARATADVSRLREVMDVLGITDLSVPDGVDGQAIDVSIPPVVTLTYNRGGTFAARLRQARSPEVTLPTGVDLAALAEIGLRILGLPPTDARTFAQAIDWHTTMIVPLPASATSFKQVTVDGQPGLMVEQARTRPDGARQVSHLVLWSSGGQVYGLDGVVSTTDMLAMAESLK